ncbi:MAG: S9 family peptidase, partial [bacterium]
MKRQKGLGAALCLAALFSMLAASKPGALIPRQVLFGNPDKAGAQISPDGSKLSFLAPLDGVLNIWVAPAGKPASAKPVTHDTGRGVRQYFWAYTNHHILYLQDKNGDENWRIYAVDLDIWKTMDLTPVEKVQARVQEVSYKYPDEILIGLNDRNPQLHDIYRLNVLTGDKQLLEENQRFVGYVSDDDYTLRFALSPTPEGGFDLFEKTSAGDWQLYSKIPQEDSLTTSPAGFDKTNRVLYMIDSRRRNTAALTSINLDTGETALIAEDEKADISDAMAHPTEKTVQAAAFTYERKHWIILDHRIDKDFAYLGKLAEGDFEVLSRTLDDSKWVVAYIQDAGPVRYYLYDRKKGKAKYLFTNRKSLEGVTLAKMKPVTIPSRDGLNLVSYLSIPPDIESGSAGWPEHPLPMVLVVHGGPWARDDWGYHPWHQWLTNRGYAVLSVNYRGSTGFGKDFTNAGNREWGGKMHLDLLDATQWAVQMGIADPKRIAIMGGSYGGYATLVGITMTPEAFSCGVDLVGPSNLVTFMNAIPPYWKPVMDLFVARIGDHRTEEGRTF